MIQSIPLSQPVKPRFGTTKKACTRRGFLNAMLLTAGISLVGNTGIQKPLVADQFTKTAAATPVSNEDTPKTAQRFEQLVGRYINEAPGTQKALENFQKNLQLINPKELTPEYQGLYMLFDHHLQRNVFDLEEGDALKDLGVKLVRPKTLEDRLWKHRIYPKPSEKLLAEGIGKRRYDALLKIDNFVNLDSEGLIRLAKSQYDAIEAQMKKIAKQIDPNKDWREVYQSIRKDHPKQDELLKTYRDEVQKARTFLLEKDLVTIPPDHLRVIETPDYYKDSIPFAAYLGGPNGSGIFMVTTVLDKDPAKAEEQLRTHNYGFIPSVTVHETMPGHHVQHIHDDLVNIDVTNPKQQTFAQILDMVPESTFFVEGWGVYSEEMMHEQGFFKKPEVELVAMRNLLWRAARAWIDPQVHTGKMKYDEAVDFLVKNVVMERDRAEVEVNRYFQHPSAVASYMVGSLQIQQLRKQVQNAEAQQFKLKAFHDNLLNGKELPVPVLAKMRFNQDLVLQNAPIAVEQSAKVKQ